jgi:hypothetical protein
MCIYSKGINPKIISKTRTNVRKPIEIHKKMGTAKYINNFISKGQFRVD